MIWQLYAFVAYTGVEQVVLHLTNCAAPSLFMDISSSTAFSYADNQYIVNAQKLNKMHSFKMKQEKVQYN